jgi:NAD(P)-dependent dehydrogenase (short-subunit alcohol dehydrogenase family)
MWNCCRASSIQQAAQQVEAEVGCIKGLVNNAGKAPSIDDMALCCQLQHRAYRLQRECLKSYSWALLGSNAPGLVA